jgi:hypothetical protein
MRRILPRARGRRTVPRDQRWPEMSAASISGPARQDAEAIRNFAALRLNQT